MKYHAKDNRENEINVVRATEDTTIKSEYGPILVTEGNFIVALQDGTQVGMTEADLKLNYRKVRSNAKKAKTKDNV